MDYTNILNDINNNCEATAITINAMRPEMNDTINTLYIMEQNQRELYSGDLIIQEKLDNLNQSITLLAVILTTSLLFTFILRSLK